MTTVSSSITTLKLSLEVFCHYTIVHTRSHPLGSLLFLTRVPKNSQITTLFINMIPTTLLAVLLTILQVSSALHFYVQTGETKCFFERLNLETLVVGKIDAFEHVEPNDYVKTPNLRVEITIDETFDSDHRVASQKSTPSGEFTFTSLDAGEHKFCLTPSYTDGSSGKKHRIFFDIALGSAHDYVDSKSTKKVDALTAKVQDLNKKLQDIHWEQESIRERESVFRNQSETTNSRVVRWTVIQLIVLIGTCTYQLKHLKSFFVKQKIV